MATEDTSFTLSADDRAKEALGRFVLHIPTLPGVVNANLYALDGTILWSSEPSLVGQRFPHNDELDGRAAKRQKRMPVPFDEKRYGGFRRTEAMPQLDRRAVGT